MDETGPQPIAQRLAAALGFLSRTAPRAHPAELPGLAARSGELLGVAEVLVLLADYGQQQLTPFGADTAPAPVDGSVAGRVFATGQPQTTPLEDGRHVLWLPLLHGANRLGVCRLTTATAAPPQLVTALTTLCGLLAEQVSSLNRCGDTIEQVRRSEPMQLAAEIVWSMLPPLSFATAEVSLAAVLEPCYEVGGDVFDYAAAPDRWQLALFDAAGHGIGATALSGLALNAYRNARRTGLDLLDCYRSIDQWVAAQYPEAFVTAILAELDTRTGVLRYINAAHPSPLLIRDGVHAQELSRPTASACGLQEFVGRHPQVAQQRLQPGDRLLLYTDGVVEARTEDQFFGVPRLDLTIKAIADRLPPPETMRRLRQAVLEHQQYVLQDDATAVLLQWRPTAA